MPNGYTIKDGDTLSRLAQKFGTTVSELAKANNITDPEKIYVGDNLRVPQKQGTGDLGGMVKQLLASMGGGMPPQGMGGGMGRPQGTPPQGMGMGRPQGMSGTPPQGSHPPGMGMGRQRNAASRNAASRNAASRNGRVGAGAATNTPRHGRTGPPDGTTRPLSHAPYG